MRYTGLLFLAICLMVQACTLFHPADIAPTYLRIDSFSFAATPLLPLPATRQITNVWVYYNNNPVGAFDLPATVPVIASGSGSVELYPGIAIDGLNEITGIYPFYEPDTFTLVAQPGRVVAVQAHTQFFPGVKPQVISDFDYNTLFVCIGGNRPIQWTTGDSVVEQGNCSGVIRLYAPGDSSVDSAITNLTIAENAEAAFIEFDYKCSVPFYVGLSANFSVLDTGIYYLAGIHPSATWQKFYLNVADFNAQYKGLSYSFFIKASLPAGQSYGEVLMEHISMLTF